MATGFGTGLVWAAAAWTLACGNAPRIREIRTAEVPTPTAIDVFRPPATSTTKPEPILDVMSSELDRSMTELAKHDDPPYFGAYTVIDETTRWIHASFGGIDHSSEQRTRKLRVELRIGNYKRDNTHASAHNPIVYWESPSELPLDNDDYAIRTMLWRRTDEAYKDARRSLEFKANVKASEPDDADDFSPAPKTEYFEAPVKTTFDRGAWEQRARDLSAAFRRYPELTMATVAVSSTDETRYYTNSEGTRYQVTRPRVSISIRILFHAREFTATSPDLLPTDDQLRGELQALVAEVSAVSNAPAIDDYDGPVVFEQQAASLFFHEVFGQLVQYRRDQKESLAFARRIGTRVMPEFLDVYDDPTIQKLNGRALSGYYRYDDEGVRGANVSLVEGGILKGLLTSRSPTLGPVSNGHGRTGRGLAFARPANLVVAASRTVDRVTLRRMLLDEVSKQGKPYGVVIRQLVGVAVTDLRWELKDSFTLSPLVVLRVYRDGREELVGGGLIAGDRLQVLADIAAASTDVETFNSSFDGGVSSTSPSILVRRIHVAAPVVHTSSPPSALPPPTLTNGPP